MQEEVKETEKEEKSMKQKKTQHTPTGRALGTQERTLQSQAVKLWAGARPVCAKHSCGKKHLEVAVAQDILHCWSLELAVRGLVLAESVQITKDNLVFSENGPHMENTSMGTTHSARAKVISDAHLKPASSLTDMTLKIWRSASLSGA